MRLTMLGWTVAATVACVAMPATALAQPAGPRIADRQELASLLRTVPARANPASDARQVAVIKAHRPLTRARTRLPVIEHATTPDGSRWLRVRLPGRTLMGHVLTSSGWIPASAAAPMSTMWHIVVRPTRRRAFIYRAGQLQRVFVVIVGKPSTPTPLGEYFVEENVALDSSAPGAPYALATSARSAVLQEFEGGPGQIALHGVDHLSGTLGTAVSHGCVRFSSRGIRWLAARIGSGVPVSIR